jgi:ribonuclease HI
VSHLIIFTDGASKGNPGNGGWGAVVASETEVKELGGGEKKTTNNRMELRAAYEALSYAESFDATSIDLYTDSSYVVKGATLWGQGWRRNGWVTKDKKPVLNRDLWERFLELIDDFNDKISWHNVGGHIGIAGNERADSIADSFALDSRVSLYTGSRLLYRINLSDLSFDEEKKATRSASRARSKRAAYSYVSEVNGIVEVHADWKSCEARVRGKKARFKKALSAKEETDIKEEFGA